MRAWLRPKRRWDDEGVASTVGTIMALLVILAFLSLIVNQWVPVYMTDTEAAHMNVALGQFGNFKGDVDTQLLAAQIALIARRHYVPVTAYSPITLGVDGIPIFAAPTPGELAFQSTGATWNVSFVYDVAGINRTVAESGSGSVELDVFNRFFIRQAIVYENGGVLRSQFDGQIVRAEPTFEVIKGNETVEYGFTLLSLFGSGSVAGTGTEGIRSRLLGADFQEYADVVGSVWINGTTPHGYAWYLFFNRTLATAWGVTADDFGQANYTFTPSVSEGNPQATVNTPFYRISAAWDTARQTYTFTLELKNDADDDGDDSDGLRIGMFRLLRGHVEVVVGERTGSATV